MRAYQEILETKRTSLLRSMEETREGCLPNDQLAADVKDRDAVLQSLMRQSRLLWIVESALKAISEGMFGRCLFCQRKIPAKQLAAIPWSAYCASCEKLADAHLKRPGETPQRL